MQLLKTQEELASLKADSDLLRTQLNDVNATLAQVTLTATTTTTITTHH